MGGGFGGGMVAGDSEEERGGFTEGFAGAEAEGETLERILLGGFARGEIWSGGGSESGGGGFEIGLGGAQLLEECAGNFGK